MKVPYDSATFDVAGATSQPSWNPGFTCGGPNLEATITTAIEGLVPKTSKRFYKNGVMRAKECAQWCKEYNFKVEQLPLYDAEGLAIEGSH